MAGLRHYIEETINCGDLSLIDTYTLYALLKRPELFQRYSAGGAYLGFVDRAMLQYEAALAQGRSSLHVKLAMVATEFDTEYRPSWKNSGHS